MQIGGDDGVQARRPQHHARGHGVDQHLVGGDLRVVALDLLEHRIPHHHAVALGIGFGNQRQQLARARAGQFQRETLDALDPVAGEDRDVDADLLGQPLMGAAADAGIFALGILAHDDPVEIARPDARQRASDARQHAGGAQIGVLVETLADIQPQLPKRNMVGNARVAGRAEIDCVERLQELAPVVRHHLAMFQVIVGAPGEGLDRELKSALALGQRPQHLDAGPDDLGPDPVARHGGDPVGLHARKILIIVAWGTLVAFLWQAR